jgi:hypothetical protein
MVDEDWLIAELSRLFWEKPEAVPDGEIRRRFEQGGIVFGVWRAPDKRGGIDRLVLTDERVFAERMASQQPGLLTFKVVPCTSYDDALRTKRMFGTSDI